MTSAMAITRNKAFAFNFFILGFFLYPLLLMMLLPVFFLLEFFYFILLFPFPSAKKVFQSLPSAVNFCFLVFCFKLILTFFFENPEYFLPFFYPDIGLSMTISDNLYTVYIIDSRYSMQLIVLVFAFTYQFSLIVIEPSQSLFPALLPICNFIVLSARMPAFPFSLF